MEQMFIHVFATEEKLLKIFSCKSLKTCCQESPILEGITTKSVLLKQGA